MRTSWKIILLIPTTLSWGCFGESFTEQEKSSTKGVEPLKKVDIVVVYDNNSYDERLTTAWGFSCLVRCGDTSILFDTGGDSSILLNNMKQLKIEPQKVDVVVLSHIHGDHVGGLAGFLEQNNKVVVYLPNSFPESFKNEVKSSGAKVEEISHSKKLLDNVYSTGELGTVIKEQSLIIVTIKGLIIITGCAHPGIVEVVRKSTELLKRTPLLVMGGFHLRWKTEQEIKEIIANFQKLGVQQVGPCHCSGDKARRLFENAYGKNFREIGVGRLITITEGELE